MTRKEVFFFGAVGGILPILVSILSIDLSPIIDHPGSLSLGNYIGFGLRGMSALGSRADIGSASQCFRLVPEPDSCTAASKPCTD